MLRDGRRAPRAGRRWAGRGLLLWGRRALQAAGAGGAATAAGAGACLHAEHHWLGKLCLAVVPMHSKNLRRCRGSATCGLEGACSGAAGGDGEPSGLLGLGDPALPGLGLPCNSNMTSAEACTSGVTAHAAAGSRKNCGAGSGAAGGDGEPTGEGLCGSGLLGLWDSCMNACMHLHHQYPHCAVA